jgi:GT2 family glycosyltransferase
LDAIKLLNDVEIIVVDNNSDDGIINSFIEKYKSVKFVKSAKNQGFGGACNLGAYNSTSEFLLFLNPDTIANNEAIVAMKDFLVENISFKIVSCKQHENLMKHFLFFPNGFRIFGLFRAISVMFNSEKFERKTLNAVDFIEPDWVSGSILMTSKAWLNQIGGWSKEFWMYSEDLDLCKKTADKKGKIALLTNVEIYHKHGGASRKNIETSAITKAEVVKSKHIYYEKHFTGFERLFPHLVLIFSYIFIKGPLAVLGIILFFIPKLKLQTLVFLKMTNHYLFALKNKSWLSKNLSK